VHLVGFGSHPGSSSGSVGSEAHDSGGDGSSFSLLNHNPFAGSSLSGDRDGRRSRNSGGGGSGGGGGGGLGSLSSSSSHHGHHGRFILTYRFIAIVVGLTLTWYSFSIGITFYNKWLFHSYGFDFPLIVTFLHMCTTCALASIGRTFRSYVFQIPKPTLGWRELLMRVAPVGAAGALDIGLSNLSLGIIEIVLYTMCKSTVLVFVLFFALVFKIERLVSVC
jgi:hypothetical protein